MKKFTLVLSVLLLGAFLPACRRTKPQTAPSVGVGPTRTQASPTAAVTDLPTGQPTAPQPITPTYSVTQETAATAQQFLQETLQSATRTAQRPTQELADAQEAATRTALPTTTSTPTHTPVPTAVPTSTPRPSSYTVQRGDTIYRLALRFKVKVETLASANNLTEPYDVPVGQVLVIPPEEAVTAFLYQVHTKDTLASIGQRFGVSWRTLAEVNGIGWPYALRVGQEIIIPVELHSEQTPVPATPVPVPSLTITPIPAATMVPTATPKWSRHENPGGDFVLDYPPGWLVVAWRVQNEVIGETFLTAFTSSTTPYVGAPELGIYRLGPVYSDLGTLHAHFKGVLKDAVPGTVPSMTFNFNWGPDSAETIGGRAGQSARASMIVETEGENPTSISMQLYLGVVIHGDYNYAVYAKAPVESWPSYWPDAFDRSLKSLIIR